MRSFRLHFAISIMEFSQFTLSEFRELCDSLAAKDQDIRNILVRYDYPPFWSRPNTFETLVHIILEQQVSLASALAALNKLKDYIQEVTPERILSLSDEELRACYFSRQKTTYVRHLAQALLDKQIDLERLETQSDEAIRTTLSKLKGIGNWTIDIYLIFVLKRSDIFPIGDLAAVNALKQLKNMPKETSKQLLLEKAADWQPYRTVATMLLWHYYLSQRVKK